MCTFCAFIWTAPTQAWWINFYWLLQFTLLLHLIQGIAFVDQTPVEDFPLLFWILLSQKVTLATHLACSKLSDLHNLHHHYVIFVFILEKPTKSCLLVYILIKTERSEGEGDLSFCLHVYQLIPLLQHYEQ